MRVAGFAPSIVAERPHRVRGAPPNHSVAAAAIARKSRGAMRAAQRRSMRAFVFALAACSPNNPATMMMTSNDGGAPDLSQPPGADLATTDLAKSTAIDLAGADLAPEAPSVRLIGRIDNNDAAGPRFSWSGSSIVARFSGTAVSVHLSDSVDHFKVLIDGQDQPGFIGSGDKTYPLATGLAAGTHDLVVYRQSEAFDGPTQFFGLTFPGGGTLLAPPPPRSHKIELIGDSISCGYGDTGTPAVCGGAGVCSFSLATEDHYQSYGATAARALDADLISVSWSGIGMVHNCCGASGSTTDTMPSYYGYALPPPASPTTNWDFANWTSELVLINLGTNDYTGGDPGAIFTSTYVTFFQRVRANYPNAYIMLLLGPMLSGSDLTSARMRLNSVLTTVNDPKSSLFEFTTEDFNAVGCDCHPTVTTHQSMATALAAEIKSKLGW
jgi:lysophospholipase L1-like esterase